MTSTPANITQLLVEWSAGNRAALDQLTPFVYEELRRLATSYLRREQPGHTLQATALVHEAYLRLVNERAMTWQNRAHFFGVAAQLMRNILVDHARTRNRAKRGGGAERLSLDETIGFYQKKDVDLIALDDALTRLANLDGQQCRIVELRFFTGLTVEETAEVVGLSTATVKREWASAKAWLFGQISRAQA